MCIKPPFQGQLPFGLSGFVTGSFEGSLIAFLCAILCPEIKANDEDRCKTSNTKWQKIQREKLQAAHVNSKNIVLTHTAIHQCGLSQKYTVMPTWF